MDWLNKSGMLVNISKTLSPQKSEPKAVNLTSKNISVAPSVKILGLIFCSDLSWHAHIDKNHQHMQKDYHAIKVLRQYLDVDKMTKIVQANFLSKLCYQKKFLICWKYIKMHCQRPRKGIQMRRVSQSLEKSNIYRLGELFVSPRQTRFVLSDFLMLFSHTLIRILQLVKTT